MELNPLGRSNVMVPNIGMGTWGIGGYGYKDTSRDREAVAALRAGIKLGLSLVDTAESYGRGHTEELIGRAIRACPRDNYVLVSKVSAQNLRYQDVIEACRRSLWRMGVRYLDLYLVHFPSYQIPLSETMQAMEYLYQQGLIRAIGVSNFSLDMMKEAQSYLTKTDLVVNQVKYNVKSRYPERGLLTYCQNEDICLMAYTPLEEGSLANNKYLSEIGEKYHKSAAQVALNWLISHKNVITIPKAHSISHLRENSEAQGWQLMKEDFDSISDTFPLE